MSDLPICECSVVWPQKGHHPACPVRHEIERLTADNKWAGEQLIKSGIEIERLHARVEALEGALRYIDDEAHDLNAAEECARAALAATEQGERSGASDGKTSWDTEQEGET